jgi:hypothetical protein
VTEQPPTDADAALKRLQELVAGGHIAEEAPELIRLADLAATKIADGPLRNKLAENLIAALSVIRYAPIFGTDTAPARHKPKRSSRPSLPRRQLNAPLNRRI